MSSGLRSFATTAAATRPPLRPLGRTGLSVSAIGLGLAGLGRPAYITLGRRQDLGFDRSVRAMRRRCHALLDTAYAAGITYVDAARSYGLAEPFLREWCDARHVPRHALTVGSKWGYVYTGAWQRQVDTQEVKRLALDTLLWQTMESRAVLGDRFVLSQIHSATLESGVLENTAVLHELARLRADGLRIGLTVSGPKQADTIRRALAVRVDGLELFETIQATWNLLEPSAADALAEAAAAGRGVIVKEVLANGRLTDRHAGTRFAPLRAYASALGTTIEAVAMASALAQPWATVVLSGAVTSQQLDAGLVALDMVPCVAPPRVAETPERYWQKRAAMAWT
jgi:aryl-alcohol dehydrogenase-like predicted oxidoreductase